MLKRIFAGLIVAAAMAFGQAASANCFTIDPKADKPLPRKHSRRPMPVMPA
jgi:hypothetical protein